MLEIANRCPSPSEAVPIPRQLGWHPDDPRWRGRIARRVVWALSADADASVAISAHLTVDLGRARPRRPLVAATRQAITRAGWTVSAPELVLTLDADEPAWWLERGTAEVWVLRPGASAGVHRPRTTLLVHSDVLQHRALGIRLDLRLVAT